MVKRLKIDRNGFYLSPPGRDVDTTPISEMLFSSQINVMRYQFTVSAYVGQGGDVYVGFPYPLGGNIFILLSRSDGATPGYGSTYKNNWWNYLAYCTRDNGLWHGVNLRSNSGSATITAKVFYI